MSYDKSNVFAKILRGEIPCDKLYEDDFVLAFRDVAPAAPSHILVIPKGEYQSFNDFMDNRPKYIGRFFQSVQNVAAAEGLEEGGYRLITNHGADANQTVPHFHVHILGGNSLGGLLSDDVLQR